MDEKKSGVGSVVGTIIIIALVVLGGLYFWGKRIEESKNVAKLTTEPTTQEQTPLTPEQMQANTISSTSSSDELNAIDTDLKATNTTDLNSEVK